MYRNLLAEMARLGYTRKLVAQRLNISLPSLRKRLKAEIPFKTNEVELLLSLFGNDLSYEYLFAFDGVKKYAH